MIPWDKIEEKYSKLFPSKTGMLAKPLRMALGSLLIQKQYGYSDEELVEQLRENPYYQYFIGMPGYEDKYPFVPSLLVEFRKRLSEEILCEVNEIIIDSAMPENDDSDDDDDSDNNSDGGSSDNKDLEESSENEIETSNSGTLILDATCAPQNIEYPQDVNLLNECREKLENSLTKSAMTSIITLPVCIVKTQGKIISVWQNVRNVLQNVSARLLSSSFNMCAVT